MPSSIIPKNNLLLFYKMFIYSLFALYYAVRSQTFGNPFTQRMCLYSSTPPPTKAYETIMKSRYNNIPKDALLGSDNIRTCKDELNEEGCDLHSEESNSGSDTKFDKTEQKRRLDDAEILNRIHHNMFSTVFIREFHHLREKVKQFSQPEILHCFSESRHDKKRTCSLTLRELKPIDIGTGELWEKFQQEGELW